MHGKNDIPQECAATLSGEFTPAHTYPVLSMPFSPSHSRMVYVVSIQI